MGHPPEAWAREAERYQRISDRRRREKRRHRRVAAVEWTIIVVMVALIFAALALNVRL